MFLFTEHIITFTSVGTLFLLPYLSSVKIGQGYIYKFFTLVSLISYSMYLVNYTLVQHFFFDFISKFIPEFSQQNLLISVIKYFLFWALTIIFSVLLFFFFEAPIIKLRDKFKV